MSTATHTHHANAEVNGDPTRTKTLRGRFEGEVGRRFRRLKGLIRTTIGYENDAFGLRANAEAEEVFNFPTDPQKRRAFIIWLRDAMADEIVEVQGLMGVREGQHYTAKYVRSAYARAIQDAGWKLRSEGVNVPDEDLETMFNLPVHESSLRRLYTRTYQNLDGITPPTARAVREELARGFAAGANPRQMATRINDRVDAIGLTRARTLARTEVINAHSLGTLDRYERLGVGMVTIEAEWSTAGDGRVCPICATFEGQTWTIQEARTQTVTLGESDVEQFVPEGRSASSFTGEFPVRPPAHPSCRCSLLPVVISASAVVANADMTASPGVRALAAT